MSIHQFFKVEQCFFASLAVVVDGSCAFVRAFLGSASCIEGRLQSRFLLHDALRFRERERFGPILIVGCTLIDGASVHAFAWI